MCNFFSLSRSAQSLSPDRFFPTFVRVVTHVEERSDCRQLELHTSVAKSTGLCDWQKERLPEQVSGFSHVRRVASQKSSRSAGSRGHVSNTSRALVRSCCPFLRITGWIEHCSGKNLEKGLTAPSSLCKQSYMIPVSSGWQRGRWTLRPKICNWETEKIGVL